VLRIIFSFCDAATVLASARGVCRDWRGFINDKKNLSWAKLVLGATLRCACRRPQHAAGWALVLTRAAAAQPRRAHCGLGPG
jgi:hypothetical protein